METEEVSPGEWGEVDDVTLARAKRRDPEAQTALVRCYQRRLFALVGRMLVSRPQLMGDAAQESFLKVLRALPRFQPGPQGRLSTWILTIATRTCLDILRAPDRSAPLPHDLPADDRLEEGVADSQLGRRLQAAMAALSEEMRAVLVLRAYHEFDYDQIAVALGIPVGTVKSRLGRAREALRAALEEKP